GGVRPYKNIDAVLKGLALVDPKVVLIVAGSESGYPDLVPGDPLGRTKRIAAELGISNRVRFLPGFAEYDALAKMLEASDILSLVYGKHYGSGLLSLGMTFGIHILATKAGGVEEYLDLYPSHTWVENESPEAIARSLDAACTDLRKNGRSRIGPPREFEWKSIAREALEHLGRLSPGLAANVDRWQ
ncbi:MAG TPA: glycosyltransferase, partial [Terriglobales bacterium]